MVTYFSYNSANIFGRFTLCESFLFEGHFVCFVSEFFLSYYATWCCYISTGLCFVILLADLFGRLECGLIVKIEGEI